MNIKKYWLFGLCGLLLITNVASLIIWQPWQGQDDASRKITVTGQATVKSAPDEYQFSPYYERKTNEEIVGLNQTIVAKLKALGVAEDSIKVTVSNYGLGSSSPSSGSVVPDQSQSTLTINVTVSDKSLAQKVQDYLVATDSKGLVSPNSVFSSSKQKQLQDAARTAAISDARKKADQSAKQLGSKVSKVIEITDRDGGNGGIIMPLSGSTSAVAEDTATKQSVIPIQPGQNEINYSVQVTFSLR